MPYINARFDRKFMLTHLIRRGYKTYLITQGFDYKTIRQRNEYHNNIHELIIVGVIDKYC